MDFNYLLNALFKKKWIIIFSTFIALGAALAFTFFMKKSYVSDAQYSTGLTQTSKVSLQTSEIFDINQIDLRFNNVVETFQSPTVEGMLSYELLLHDIESSHPFRVLTDKQKKDTAYTLVDFSKAKEILHRKLSTLKLLSSYDEEERRVWDLLLLYEYDDYEISKKLYIERIKNSDFLLVEFSSENAELSAFVVNTIGEKFLEFYNSLQSVVTKESLQHLDSLTRAQQKRVDSLQTRLENFRAKNGNSKTGDYQAAAVSSASEADSRYTNEQTNLNKLISSLDVVNNQLENLDKSSSTSGTSQNNNNTEILRLKKENDNLSAQLMQKGGNDPDIQSKITANITKMNNLSSAGTVSDPVKSAERIQTTRETLINKRSEIQGDIEASRKNLDVYRQQANVYKGIANSGGGSEVVAAAYENDLKSALAELDKYKNSVFQSQNLTVNPDFNFRQTLLGQPPLKAMPLHRTIIVGVSGLAMFLIVSLIIIILEFLDPSLRSPSIFQRETNLKLMTVVNKMDLNKRDMKENFDMGSAENINVNSKIFIESFRKLRFELENSGKKIILISSLKSQEGKSTLLEALAYTFSMTKKKILLIDANFSNNTITRKFSAKPTLENFTLGVQDNPTDKIWGITTLTDIVNVDVIGCNEGNYTPAEVLPKNNLLFNLHKVGQHYDFIFIEGAALDNHADSKELSKYADGIVIVYSAKNSLGEIDKESLQFLKNSTSDKFIGAILNNVEKDYLDA
ncbi:MAG TPA: Wzz/FepE/Etk N-terminal domain-containing protein [Puia sp.]|jgi:succinoglycan biosynthesis transport protein ExoP|nr:Wzz/FepE/Etk N-terminal domain-containing protein [Puia sp.]